MSPLGLRRNSWNGSKPVTRIAGAASTGPSSPNSAPKGALHLPPGVGLGQGLPLVVLTLAAAESDLDLGTIVREVEAQGNQRIAALLHLAGQAGDLLCVEQQLPRPQRL